MTCCDDSVDKGPHRVFDSRKARDMYDDYLDYRSQTIYVPPGYIALIELYTPEEYLPDITFSAVKMPVDPEGKDLECYEDCRIGKRYRRWKCSQSLGNNESINGQPTTFTQYNSTIVYWGADPFTDDLVEFEYLVRPGHYYLSAVRCVNDRLEDCSKPTIIDMTLIPVHDVHDLTLRCNCSYKDYWSECCCA